MCIKHGENKIDKKCYQVDKTVVKVAITGFIAFLYDIMIKELIRNVDKNFIMIRSVDKLIESFIMKGE